ncbi:cytochrome b/b6 domain-containing protein [Streptomyces sp. CRN 30]|uniref:cytochrome b/b6 domain-containing protein n=1 Tax=Streptomyces sp. CRN 30 TaxID=3075613 RepID=UPI002A808D51|nr:cytochrome b/b6 domain-containing protein [Streptomyces sp. CRN 30]
MNPRRSNSSLPQPGRSVYGAATAAALLLIPLTVLLGGDGLREFLNFGAGVLSLVALSCSVIWGLVATDRVFLNARQRIIAQAVHRTTAISSVAFLLLHVTVKLATDRATLLTALVPFSLGVTGSGLLIGFGSLAALLMVTTAVTGALRSAFATPAPVAARWRAFHMLAYPAWCFALVHGLYAGREAKPIFVTLYCLCLVGVAGALVLRSAPRPFKRRVADRVMAVLGTESRPGREELDASRARVAGAATADTLSGAGTRARGGDSPLPGYGARGGSFPGGSAIPPQRTSSSGLYESAARADAPGSGPGFAAAYRAVSASPRAGDPLPSVPDRPVQPPADMQPTQAVPRLDDSFAGDRWPAPSPPPVGEAPPSAYDPMQDTFGGGSSYQTAPYRTAPFQGSPETSYATVEQNAPFGTYNTNDTYDSGPATETLPGAFDAPSSGEPWNMPSGGPK